MATKKKKRTIGELVSGNAPYDTPATRSAHVREYLKSHRNAAQRKPQAIVAHFAEHGITLTAALISQIKANAPKRSQKQKSETGLDHLLAAKKLLELTSGDLGLARKTLEVVKKLQS